MLRLMVADVDSPSYFVATAAVELGFFKESGLDVELELIFPVDKAYAALRSGAVDFVGGSAHSALATFPQWEGVKLLCAQAQGMYWFLVMHKDLKARRGDLEVVKGRNIGAAPWVDMGLRRLLIEAGLDLERDRVKIAPVPGATGQSVNFGLTAARALEDRKIDGFWANGMGAEVAVSRGVGTVVLDVRRGGQQTQDRERQGRLARAGLADDPQRLTRPEGQRDLIDGLHCPRPPTGHVVRRKLVELQERTEERGLAHREHVLE